MAPGRVIGDAVWRVGDHEVRNGPGQQPSHGFLIGAVATGDPMLTQAPDVPSPRYRGLVDVGNFVLVRQTLPTRRREYLGQLLLLEAED